MLGTGPGHQIIDARRPIREEDFAGLVAGGLAEEEVGGLDLAEQIRLASELSLVGADRLQLDLQSGGDVGDDAALRLRRLQL